MFYLFLQYVHSILLLSLTYVFAASYANRLVFHLCQLRQDMAQQDGDVLHDGTAEVLHLEALLIVCHAGDEEASERLRRMISEKPMDAEFEGSRSLKRQWKLGIWN